MSRKLIIIAEMLQENLTNGVTRYSEMLISGLPTEYFELVYLKFVYSSQQFVLPFKNENIKYSEIVIPLPVNSNEILFNNYWNSEYNKIVVHLIEPYLQSNFIFHIQTLNLIDLAIFLRDKYSCKIVSHIHCIPWKYKYSTDQHKFNQLYFQYKVAGNTDLYKDDFISKNEYTIFKESDAVICVTKSAKIYYEKYLFASPQKTFCVYNGIKDYFENDTLLGKRENLCRTEQFRLLYVGSITRNKGFHFILQALRNVKKAGYDFVLYAAGTLEECMRKQIYADYADLNIRLLGQISYSQLQYYYQLCHIGLIPSLFEQCSYVAIEMSMFGLPVIFSDIEELIEIFGNEIKMSIPIKFSVHSSLQLDISEFSSKIIHLMNSPELCREIGHIERARFLKYFRQEQMIFNTIEVYKSLK